MLRELPLFPRYGKKNFSHKVGKLITLSGKTLTREKATPRPLKKAGQKFLISENGEKFCLESLNDLGVALALCNVLPLKGIGFHTSCVKLFIL